MKAFLIMNWDHSNSEPVSLWFSREDALAEALRLTSDRHNGGYEVMEFSIQGALTDTEDIRDQIIPIIQSAMEQNTRGFAETIAAVIKRDFRRA